MKPFCLLLALFPFVVIAQFPLPYCAESFSSVHPIKRFKFSNIDNYSSDALNGAQHENFTSKVINAFPGTNTVTAEAYSITTGPSSYDFVGVAIDFNEDGIFQPGELVGIAYFETAATAGFRTKTFELFIPYNISPGNYRLRVLKTFEYPVICQVNANRKGQAEDYTIHISTPSCYAPDSYFRYEVNHNSATLGWSPPASPNLPDQYNWELRTDSLPGTNSTALVSGGILPVSSSQQFFTVGNLKAFTNYYFFIRSNCSGTYSEWRMIDFTTTFCGNNENNYAEDFFAYTAPKLSDCIVVQDVNGDGIKWEKEEADNNILNHSAAIHITSNGMPAADDWFFTPFRILNAGQVYVLKFLYKGAKADSGAIQNLEVKLGTEQKAAGMYKTLYAKNDIASVKTSAYQSGRVIFIPDSTGAYTIGFRCWSNANKADFYMDDISFYSTDCTWPDSVAVTDITSNSVKFNWKKGITSLANPKYNWEIRATTIPPYTAPVIASGTTSNLFVLANNLVTGTNYDIFVRMECAAGGFYGAWSDPVTFKTSCVIDHVPYTFQGALKDSACFKFFDANHDGETWRMGSVFDLKNVTAPYMLGKVTNDNDDWIFTPYFNLKADSTYRLSFTAYPYNAVRSIEISYGPAQHPDSMLNSVIYQNTTSNNLGSSKRFKVPSDGTYSFGFHNYDQAPGGFNMIYRYTLETAPFPSLEPKFLKIDSLFATGLTIRWNAPDSVCPGNVYQWEIRSGYDNSLIASGTTTDTFVTFNYQYPAILKDNFLVRSVCQSIPDANWSTIIIPNNVNCYLNPANVPFFQDNFDTECHSLYEFVVVENSNNDGYKWTRHSANSLPLLNSEAAVYRGTRSINPADDWFFTGKINLQANRTYKISFRYKSSNGSGGKQEKLEVKYGFDAKSTRMFPTPLFIDDNITTDTSDQYLVGEAIIHVGKDSSYNFGFHCFSDKDQARLFVDSILISEEATLPVSEMTLQAVSQKNNILLTWKTITEINNTGFEVQRSADGQHFSKINFKTTKAVNGSSNSTLQYDLMDNNPFVGNNYYRLKQVDKNGNYRYSNTVTVYFKATNQPSIAGVYPNPASNLLNIRLNVVDHSGSSILITDMAGRKLMQTVTIFAAGSNLAQVDISKLPKGMYMLQLQCSEGCNSQFVKFEKR